MPESRAWCQRIQEFGIHFGMRVENGFSRIIIELRVSVQVHASLERERSRLLSQDSSSQLNWLNRGNHSGNVDI